MKLRLISIASLILIMASLGFSYVQSQATWCYHFYDALAISQALRSDPSEFRQIQDPDTGEWAYRANPNNFRQIASWDAGYFVGVNRIRVKVSFNGDRIRSNAEFDDDVLFNVFAFGYNFDAVIPETWVDGELNTLTYEIYPNTSGNVFWIYYINELGSFDYFAIEEIYIEGSGAKPWDPFNGLPAGAGAYEYLGAEDCEDFTPTVTATPSPTPTDYIPPTNTPTATPTETTTPPPTATPDSCAIDDTVFYNFTNNSHSLEGFSIEQGQWTNGIGYEINPSVQNNTSLILRYQPSSEFTISGLQINYQHIEGYRVGGVGLNVFNQMRLSNNSLVYSDGMPYPYDGWHTADIGAPTRTGDYLRIQLQSCAGTNCASISQGYAKITSMYITFTCDTIPDGEPTVTISPTPTQDLTLTATALDATATSQGTYTPQATYTPQPTYTQPSTATITRTPAGTPYPTNTPLPTFTPFGTVATATPFGTPNTTPFEITPLGTIIPQTPIFEDGSGAGDGIGGTLEGLMNGTGRFLGFADAGMGALLGAMDGLTSLGFGWFLAPPIAPPLMPDCVNNPLDSNICAIWYILENTFFARIGSLYIPIITVVIHFYSLMKIFELIAKFTRWLRERRAE